MAFRGPGIRVFPLALAVFACLCAAATAHGPAPRATDLIRLATGDSAFWDGQTVSGDVPDAGLCGVGGPCFDYPLRLARGGRLLRVALDTPSRQDTFELQVVDPAGAVAASTTNSNQFNDEVFVEGPMRGTWTVRVLPQGAEDAFFRLRAKLEGAAAPGPGRVLSLLPNLRTVPPLELGFIAPLNPANGLYPPDTANPPADAAGVHPVSCTADEAAPRAVGGFEAVHCLRLTSGPINVGDGPYDMRFSFTEDLVAGEGELAAEGGTIQEAAMFQAIHRSDGSLRTREAGTYSFHLTHGHFHDNNVLTYELYRVLNRRTGTLRRASRGTKSGFCPADQLFGRWRRFEQEPAGYFGEGDQPTGNCFSFSDGFLGLTVGWGDVYRWQRPGQYVEFDGNGDGLYVVRSTVDKPDEVVETDETDNASYALVRVVGERVDILERGQGRSPWDRRKLVFEGAGPASQD